MSKKTLSLLPHPQHLTYLEGTFTLPDKQLMILNAADPQTLYVTGRCVQRALENHAGVNWPLVAGTTVPHDRVGMRINIVTNGTLHPQGYTLTIAPGGISIVGSTPAGVFYGAQTLIQIVQQRGHSLPLLNIRDWPDFPNRGVMLDISRDKVPTMDTLYQLVDRLAGWKINQFQLYTEHTFAYQNHSDVWAEASPLTGEEILALDAYCRERFLELVPNQNTFGHMRRWLIHDRYRPLAECPHGCDTGHPEWGYFDEPFTLCPTDPGSLDLIRTLLDELLPHFSSRHINVGCDETVELGLGRSADAVAQRGQGRVYLDYLLKLYREVKARGRTMQFWGDIILNYPDLISDLPPDVIAMAWGYEADDPLEAHSTHFAASGIPFYVCPGTSSWNSVAGRADNAIKNLQMAAESGLRHGAIGYLITDWGDNGHWQPLPASYLGFSYGAALSWAYEANQARDIISMLDIHVFDDFNGIMGRLAVGLGKAHHPTNVQLHNSTILFQLLQENPEEIRKRETITQTNLEKTLAQIDELAGDLDNLQLNHADGELIKREYAWVINMLKHACRRGLWALDPRQPNLQPQLAEEADHLIAEHRAIWLARNRPGGLKDSAARLEKMRQDYDD